MNESQINLDLYNKMRDEQDEYRHWLLAQTPKEILNHASEYSAREDILATMCEGHLPPMLAKALMGTEHPLACVYAELQNSDYRDRNYGDLIDVIQDCATRELRASPRFMEICIYQIDHSRDRNRVAYIPSDQLSKIQGSDQVMSSLYNSVFRGIVERPTLEGIYYMFNVAPPEGYTGQPLSMSDVVQVISSPAVEPGFYYCERFGFTKINFEPEKTQDMTNAIWVLLLESGKTARPVLINNTMEDMEKIVGGRTASVNLPEGCLLMLREGANLTDLPANRVIRRNGRITDVIVGTCFICGTDGDHFASLTKSQMEFFKKEFLYPQKITYHNREYHAKDIKPHEMER